MQLLEQAPTEVSDLTQILIQRYAMTAGDEFTRHQHRHHQLSWAPDGLMTAETDAGSWSLAPAVALWLPSQTPHAIGVPKAATFHNVCFLPERCPITWSIPTMVPMTDLLRALIVLLVDIGLPEPQRCRAEAVVFDCLLASSGTTSDVPLPADERARAIARSLLADPSDNRTLEEWGQLIGASRRMLARKFIAETGLSFTDWRARVRVREAMHRLSAGHSITSTAMSVGYRDIGAFIEAFQRATGRTPGAYAAQRGIAS